MNKNKCYKCKVKLPDKSVIPDSQEKLAVGFNDDWSVRYMTSRELEVKYPEVYEEARVFHRALNKKWYQFWK